MVGILTDRRDLAVRFAHELLELLLKQLIGSLGRRGRSGCSTLGTILGRRIVLTTGCTAAEIIAALSGGCFPLGLGFQPLDGQIDLAAIQADDHDFHFLTFGQMLADIADVGICHLRNMYHTGFVIFQGDKCAKIGDCFYLKVN